MEMQGVADDIDDGWFLGACFVFVILTEVVILYKRGFVCK